MKLRLSKLQSKNSIAVSLMQMPLIVILLLISACGYSQKNNKSSQYRYKPALFADKDREQKIESALPVLDRMLAQYAEKNHFPSFVYGLIVDGKLIHTGSYGYSNLDKQIKASAKTDFRIASMTKSFTAMAILKLRDQGKLKLDDPVYKYIPEMKDQHYPTKDAAPITIRNLLTHGAGFPEDNPWGDRQLANSDEQLLGFVRNGISFSNDPGSTYEYSNLGFTLLGYLIKKVSGESYEKYITENILTPLGMTHTYWEYSKVPQDAFALGYRWLNEKWIAQPVLHDGAFGAMGGMITTIEDFSKYVALHLDAWPVRDDIETGPIKRSSIREMQFPWNFSDLNTNFHSTNGNACPYVSAYAYGLGWTRFCDGRVFVGHSGGLPGYGSQWRILPDYGIGIIAFSNLTYAPAGAFNLQALDTLLKIADLKPRVLPASEILTKRRDELVKVLPDWNIDKGNKLFAMNFLMDYFTDSLRKRSKVLFDRVGKIISISEVVPENQLRGYFDMIGENGRIRIRFTLTPEREPKIQEFAQSFVNGE